MANSSLALSATNWQLPPAPSEQVPLLGSQVVPALPSPAFPKRCQSQGIKHTSSCLALGSAQRWAHSHACSLLNGSSVAPGCGCQLGTPRGHRAHSYKGSTSCWRWKEGILLLMFRFLGQIASHRKLMCSISKTILCAR